MKTILTLTLNPTIDMSSSVENVFPEHKLRCGPVLNEPGGGMVAGITLGLARDYSWRDAVRLRIAAGAASVMTSGTELCRGEGTERLFQQIE